MEKYVKDLIAGDTTESYEVLSATIEGGKVVANVLFVDGGTSFRVWDEPNTIVTVKDKIAKLR